MIRQATIDDIEKIAETYAELLTYEIENGSMSNWKLGIYPTIQVPIEKIPTGTMYVLENENNQICASMVLNNEQAKEYSKIKWNYIADEEEVLVIHTLCIPPKMARHNYGTEMVNFAKQFALKNNYSVIRIDTYAFNEPAKKMYLKNGFKIAGYGRILLQGLIDEEQVYLEYRL